MATAPKFSPADVAHSLRQRAGAGAARPGVRIWLALGTVYILWGSTYLGIKYAIDTIPPFLMGSLRFLVAGGVLYLLASRTGGTSRDRVGARQWLAALLIGGALLVGGNGGVILAEQYVPTGVVALLVATAPLWMAVIDRVVFGRRLPVLAIVGLLIGFSGVAFLIGWPGAGRPGLLGERLGLHPSCQVAQAPAGGRRDGNALGGPGVCHGQHPDRRARPLALAARFDHVDRGPALPHRPREPGWV